MSNQEPVLEIWQKKLDFLQQKEAITADPILKFELQEHMNECEQKIEELKYIKTNEQETYIENVNNYINALNNKANENSLTIKDIKELFQYSGIISPKETIIILNTIFKDKINIKYRVKIEIEEIEQGSIKLILKGSKKDIEKIEKLFKTGNLTEISGIPVKNIQLIDSLDLQKRQLALTIDGDINPDFLAELNTELKQSRLVTVNRDNLRTPNLRFLIVLLISIPTILFEYSRQLQQQNSYDHNIKRCTLQQDCKELVKINQSLDGINLNGANLIKANFIGANLTKASFTGANLTGANLFGANLTKASFTGADLTGANLFGANLTKASFIGTNLTGTNLIEANLIKANFNGANFTKTSFTGANLTGASLNGANLIKADFIRANFTGANLIKANFTKANLIKANFTKANLTGASLFGANLTGASLFGANLNSANLTNTQIKTTCEWKSAIYTKVEWDISKKEWILKDPAANQKRIDEINNDIASNPKKPPNCKIW